VATLRGEYLKRNRYRYAISSRFNNTKARKRVKRKEDDKTKDDDRHKLKTKAGAFTRINTKSSDLREGHHIAEL
jgi:hypothetical protein